MTLSVVHAACLRSSVERSQAQIGVRSHLLRHLGQRLGCGSGCECAVARRASATSDARRQTKRVLALRRGSTTHRRVCTAPRRAAESARAGLEREESCSEAVVATLRADTPSAAPQRLARALVLRATQTCAQQAIRARQLATMAVEKRAAALTHAPQHGRRWRRTYRCV